MICSGSLMVAKLFCESVRLFTHICFHMISHFGNTLKVIQKFTYSFFLSQNKIQARVTCTTLVFMMNRIKCLEDWRETYLLRVLQLLTGAPFLLVGGAGGLASPLCLFTVTMGWHTHQAEELPVCPVFIYSVNGRRWNISVAWFLVFKHHSVWASSHWISL